MKNIGFMGGSSMVELGSASEMADFFTCFFSNLRKDRNREVLERLYKKYVRIEELDEVVQMTKDLKEDLLPDIRNKYSKYISAIEICIESAKIFYESWGNYQPLKVGRTDIPFYLDDKERPMEQYDELRQDDLPLWLR